MRVFTAAKYIMSDKTQRNEWCRDPNYETYMRKTERVLGGERLVCIDISSINAVKPGSGTLDAHIAKIEKAAQRNWYAAVFVENVQEPRLRPWFEARGYVHHPVSVDHDAHSPCYYKLLKEN